MRASFSASAAFQKESSEQRLPEDDGGGRAVLVLIMAPGISASERSAWRPSAADSSCMFEPSEDADGVGRRRRR